MNTITQWNPFREMEELSNRLSSFWGTSAMRPRNGEHEPEGAWAPRVDILEGETHYVIQADLPGVSKKDVQVKVENGVLYITGERKYQEPSDAMKLLRTERPFGTFLRTFTFPEDADADRVDAEFRDGLLTLRLHKQEAARPRQIEIR